MAGLILAFGGTIVAFPAAPAFAASNPFSDYFYYMTSATDTSEGYHIGCVQGQRDAAYANKSSLVVLDWGGQELVNGSYGTKLIGGSAATDYQEQQVATSVAHGYYVCTGSDTTSVMTLAIGTNNSLNVSSAYGTDWANNVGQTVQDVVSYSSQVHIAAADDFEPGFGIYSTASSWMSGYDGTTSYAVYDYGSADGCPTSGTGGCNNGWTQADLHYLSWGAPPAYPYPEIYANNGANAQQWAAISSTQGGESFSGALSQAYTCAYTGQAGDCPYANQGPDSSWSQLAGDTGQTPEYEADIAYEYQSPPL